MAARRTRDFILVVEDDPGIRGATVQLLGRHGYRVRSVRNGLEALRFLHRHRPPRLILLDLHMPFMDGWQFCEAKQHSPALRSIPVIVISSDEAIEEAAGTFEATAFMHKPVEAETLFHAVDRSLQPSCTSRGQE